MAKPTSIRKMIAIDRDTFNAVSLLAEDQMKDLPEIVEEALRDLLKKHGRSADLREQLRASTKGERRR
jgi:hypothetical protein